MIKLIYTACILALLIPTSAMSWWMVMQGVEEEAAGGCTGDETLQAFFENSDTVTSGTPAGCSAGTDSIWTNTNATYVSSPTGDATYGETTTYALYHDSTSDNMEIDVTSEDLVNDDSGTITFYGQFPIVGDFGDSKVMVNVYADGDNYIRVAGATGGELVLSHRGNDTTVTATTTDCDLVVDEWVYIEIKWRRGAYTPNLLVTCQSVTGGAGSANSDTDLTDFTTAISAIQINGQGWGMRGYYEDMHVYDTYQ